MVYLFRKSINNEMIVKSIFHQHSGDTFLRFKIEKGWDS